jgi:O-antigen/teichoic acid export membrane protein
MTILVVRILTPEDYGMFGLLMIAIEYLGPLTHCNISSWYVWKDLVTEEEERTVELTVLLLSVTIFLIAFVSAPFFANFFNHPELTGDFRIISFLFLLMGLNRMSIMKFEKEINFKPTAILNVCLRFSQGLLTLVFAMIGLGYKSLIYSILIISLIRTAVLVKLQPPVLLSKIQRFNFRTETMKESWLFGMNITMGMFFWILYTNSDNLIIGKMFGAEILGFYSLAFFFIDLPLSKLNEWIRPVLHPYFSRLKGDLKVLNKIFLRFVFIYLAILMPIFIGIAVVADDFVLIVLGEKWVGSIQFLRLLAVVGLMRALADLVPPYLTGLGKPQYDKYYNAMGAAILPVSFFIASTYFGIKGIILVWYFIYPIIPIMMLFFFKKYSGISFYIYLKNVFPQIISSCIMLLVVLIVKFVLFGEEVSILKLLVEITAGAASYSFAMLLFFKANILEAKRIFQH